MLRRIFLIQALGAGGEDFGPVSESEALKKHNIYRVITNNRICSRKTKQDSKSVQQKAKSTNTVITKNTFDVDDVLESKSLFLRSLSKSDKV